MTKIGLSLLIVALIVGMTGCAYGSTRPVRYDLTIASGEGGSVDIPGEGTFTCDSGRAVDLVAIPASGYRFVKWTGSADTIANVNAASTAITMNDDYSITASFEETEATYYTLTMAVAGGGSTSPAAGQRTYAAGTVVYITASPASGYQFDRWTGDVDTVDNRYAASTTITIYGSYSITANFEETGVTYYTLTTSVSPSGGGSVSPPGGAYPAGSQVTLTAMPASGYTFSNWAGAAGGSQNPITISMNSNKSITAYFEETGVTYYTLTTSVSPSGGGSVSPAGGTYAAGSQVTLTAMPASGYSFNNWGGDASGSQNPITIIMNSNKSITAYFEQGPPVPPDQYRFIVSAGETHTVGLKSNGTVVAVGDNEHGQRDVDGWTNIIQVAAGGYHTVGLKSDGTVLAAGYNYYGQCNVGGWTNIIQVAAGAYHTVGLKYDGTVVAVGYAYWWQCNVGAWTNIIQVAAGGYHTVGLKSNGTAVAVGYNYHGQCDVSGWANIIQVAAGGYHTVGLKSDGTAVAVGDNGYERCNIGAWTNIIQVAAGGYHTVGLKSNGAAVAVGYNYHGQCDVSSWTNIIQVAAGGYHTAGLKSDGAVVAVGANWWGQCDVGGWDLS
ncbi:MAG: hypothetical protein WBH01_01755 [Dehalococcoidia bacterium]